MHIYVDHITFYCSLQSHWNSYESISIFGFTKQVSGKICIKKNVLLLTGWRLPPSLATFSVRSLFCHRMICYHVFISVSTRSVVNHFMCISLFLSMVLSRSLLYFMLFLVVVVLFILAGSCLRRNWTWYWGQCANESSFRVNRWLLLLSVYCVVQWPPNGCWPLNRLEVCQK